jgi:hypothetical protein
MAASAVTPSVTAARATNGQYGWCARCSTVSGGAVHAEQANGSAGSRRQPLVAGQTREVMQAYPTLAGAPNGSASPCFACIPRKSLLLPQQASKRPSSVRAASKVVIVVALLRAHPAVCDN